MTTNTCEISNTNLLNRLVEDVELLAMYLRQKGIAAHQVATGEKLVYQFHLAKNNTPDETLLTNLFEMRAELCQFAAPVTADTLRVTRPPECRRWQSPVGRHLIVLWGMTGLVAVFILIQQILAYATSQTHTEEQYFNVDMWLVHAHYVANLLLPFAYGALGSCAYLLRVTEQRLYRREFDPARIPEHWNRFVLGSLNGGVLTLLVESIDGFKITTAVLGLLGGYSIDFVFDTMDRIIGAVLPKVGLDSVTKKTDIKRKQNLLRKYEKMIGEQDRSAAEKQVIQDVIEDLKEP